MQEKKELKIKFSTVIAIIISLIIIIAIISVILNRSTQDKNKENNILSSTESENKQTGTDFTMQFLQLENNKQNMIYSPLSIKYALNMLNEGANGNTKTQIENVIGNLSLTKYNNIDEVLSLANSVYIRDTYSKDIKEEYIKTLNDKYNAEINYDSFANANNINKWIENKTLGIIKNMIDDNVVQNPYTQMLLINALAINMEWQEPFEDNTYGEKFYLADGSQMNATMMHKETKSDNITYYKDQNTTVLTMDLKKYDDTQLEFIAIMPEENLSSYIEKFSTEDLNNIMKKTTLASKTDNGLEITIPRFSFEYNLKLKEDLMKLGITDAFDMNLADFSNMANEKLFVSDALHKADIDFTEKGIKAAAVTAMILQNTAIIEEPTSPEVIKIDKPFMYFIQDKNTKEIWFVGTVYEPDSWEEDSLNY